MRILIEISLTLTSYTVAYDKLPTLTCTSPPQQQPLDHICPNHANMEEDSHDLFSSHSLRDIPYCIVPRRLYQPRPCYPYAYYRKTRHVLQDYLQHPVGTAKPDPVTIMVWANAQAHHGARSSKPQARRSGSID